MDKSRPFCVQRVFIFTDLRHLNVLHQLSAISYILYFDVSHTEAIDCLLCTVPFHPLRFYLIVLLITHNQPQFVKRYRIF